MWASGKKRINPDAPLHTNFKLAKSGGYLGLMLPDGVTMVSAFSPAYPPQYADVSYGRDRVDPSQTGYFTNATPGGPNAFMSAGFAPEVLFSVASGTFQQPFQVSLSTTNANAVIHYVIVTNATDPALTNAPSLSWPVYSGPIPVNTTIMVRAQAFSTQTNYFPVPPHSEAYIQITSDAASFTSDLPIVVFQNYGAGDVPAATGQFASMQVFEPKNGRSSMANPPDLATRTVYHRHGSSTLWDPKPNLRVETQDELGGNNNVPLAGLPDENDWIFYGVDMYDKSALHNPLVHELFREMGHYTSRTRFVEVYMKRSSGMTAPVSAADYGGLYVIEEKIKIGKNRVAINQLQPENTNAPSVTGGYLLSIDRQKADNNGNPIPQLNVAGVSIDYLDPDYLAIASPQRAAQQEYLSNYFNTFYNALYGRDWTNPATGYAAYIDRPSWIDYHLHQEFVFCVDMLRLSAYFQKPRGGPLVQGPLWDFDRSAGTGGPMVGDNRGFNPRLWRSNDSDGGTDPFNSGNTFNNPWYGRLFLDPDFFQQWIDRYQALRRNIYSLSNLTAQIDFFARQAVEAALRDAARWSGSGNSDTSPRSGLVSGDGYTYRFPTPGTYQGEVNFLKTWYTNRVDFMDTNFLHPPVFSSQGGLVAFGYGLTIDASTREANSRIYYTLDGTDPRLPGGAVSPRALSSLNSATCVLTNNARVIARNWNSSHHNLTGPGNPPLSSPWSGPTAASFSVTAPTQPLEFQSVSVLSDNQIRLLIQGASGGTYALEVSTNLTAWITLTNFVATNSVFEFDDARNINSAHRFYRIRQ